MKNFLLFMVLFLGGCFVDFGIYEITAVDQTILSNLDKDYYSIDSDGMRVTNTYSSLSFDTDKSRLIISNVIDGVATSPEWYYMQLLEENGNTNAAFLLFGNNYGRYNDMYMGISVLTNRDGSFLKWHMQDREAFVLDIVASSTEYSYASDKLIFRLHKNYLDTTASEVDSNGEAISGGANFTASSKTMFGEYAFNSSDCDNSLINKSTTTLYVLDDSSIEVMTKDGGGYIVIEYDNNSTKMKMIELDSSVTISKSSVVSALASAKEYDFPPILDEPDPDPEPEPSAALVDLMGT